MSGSPWGWMTGEKDAVHGRLTVLRLIEKMATQGWKLVSIKNIFFYKNLVEKNIEPSDSPKIKNMLRTYEGFELQGEIFAKSNT